jgi:hypothetical protein
MLHLQRFYKIQPCPSQSPPQKTLSPDTDSSILFLEIARIFGLAFWLKEGIEG